MREKACTACGCVKPVDQFGSDKRLRSGLRSRCKECSNTRSAAWRAANPEKFKAAYERWRAENKSRVKEVAAAWRRKDPEKRREYSRIVYAANKERELERGKRWAKANREKRAADCAAYLAKKVAAIPPWADKALTDAIYAEAQELRRLGVDVHVDHIVPLQGETVSGLHWHWNLRVVLASENVAKKNKLLEALAWEPPPWLVG